jgi:hypothetical protein
MLQALAEQSCSEVANNTIEQLKRACDAGDLNKSDAMNILSGLESEIKNCKGSKSGKQTAKKAIRKMAAKIKKMGCK